MLNAASTWTSTSNLALQQSLVHLPRVHVLRHVEVRRDGRAEAVPLDERAVVPVVDAVRRGQDLEVDPLRLLE